MKNLYLSIVTCLVFTSSTSLAHNRTLTESFIHTLPEAVADGVLIDTPIAILLWGLGMEPASNIPIATVMAAGGYAIRKTCKDYFDVQKKDWKRAALCGFLGGSAKYTVKSALMGKLSYVEPILGAVDAGTYEATANVGDNYEAAKYAAIEGAVSALCYALRPAGDTPKTLWKEVKIGATVGVLVSGAVKTTVKLYEQSVKDFVEDWTQWWDADPNGEPQKKTEL